MDFDATSPDWHLNQPGLHLDVTADGFSTLCRKTGRPCIMARLLARQVALAGQVTEAFELEDDCLSGRVRSGCPQSEEPGETCLMAFAVEGQHAYVFGGISGRETVGDLMAFAASAYPPVDRIARRAGPDDARAPERAGFGPVLVPALVQVSALASLATAAGEAAARRGGRAARLRKTRG